MVERDTLEALAFGVVLIVAISGTALGFNALATGGPILDQGNAALDGTNGADNATDHDDHGDGGGHHGADDDSADHHGGGGDHSGDMDGGDMGGMMQMRMVQNGTVINGNTETVPEGCDELAGERSLTIHGGVQYADGGEMFSYERDRLELDRCTRVTVTFVNEDDIRHQWMLHGLPSDVYPMGMFNVEVDGPGSATGTFITPGSNVTLNTHCSLPQHEQKGMQMSIVIGDGGDSGMNH